MRRSVIALVLTLGCGSGAPQGDGEGGDEGDGAGGEGDVEGGGESETRIRPSEMLERLRAAGLDPENLPALSEMTTEQKQNALMPAFSRSLGVECRFCHEAGNYAAPTEHRAVARHMYEEFVRKLKMEDGSPVFCDSCHAGQSEFLERDDQRAVRDFMQRNFVVPMARRDGSEHGCDTCHGEPPRWQFLPTTPG